jgi:hypothetical protein
MKSLNKFVFEYFGCITLAFFISILAGCSSKIVDPGAQPTGAFSGRVLLYDGSGKALASDSGVTITNANEMVTTNDSGYWLMPGVLPGNYTLTFTKSGFGTIESFVDSSIVNDTTKLPTVVMSEAPADMVGLLAFEFIAPNTLNFSCKMPTPYIANRTVVCCLSTDSASLAENPYEAPWIFASVQQGSGYDGTFSVDTTISEASIANDTILYATVCIAGEGTNYQSVSSYYNPVAKQEVYSALGPHSRILSVTIP